MLSLLPVLWQGESVQPSNCATCVPFTPDGEKPKMHSVAIGLRMPSSCQGWGEQGMQSPVIGPLMPSLLWVQGWGEQGSCLQYRV